MDFPAMKPHEIQDKLGLTRIRDRNWYVQPTCAAAGDGLHEGLSWLSKYWTGRELARFIVLYARVSTRKHKKWEGDGILICYANLALLKTEDEKDVIS
ncbi:hypothetical protein OSTOST_14724, partial [Ostertagia ostertagi]